MSGGVDSQGTRKRHRAEQDTSANAEATGRSRALLLRSIMSEHSINTIKMIDQNIALDVAGFAGVPTRDARGNLLQSLWSKHYDTSNVGLLLERNDIRVLLLKQLEGQIKEQKDAINMLEENDVLCKWILQFTQSWEEQYNKSKMQFFDIGQLVLSAMKETFFLVEDFLEQYSPVQPSLMRTRLVAVLERAQQGTLGVSVSIGLDADTHSTAQPAGDVDDLHVQLFGVEDSLIRLLFRNEYFGMHMRRVAGKILKKQEVCNKPGAYSARVQRNDVTQEVDNALDQFCKILEQPIMHKCFDKIMRDETWLLRMCIDHRGLPKTHNLHTAAQT